MDTFVEIMVKKKKTMKDFLLMMGCSLLSGILFFIMFFIVMPAFSAFASIIFLAIAGIVYGAYKLIKSFNVEFEYVLTNDEIDVDKIIDRKRRKRLTVVKLRTLDGFGLCRDSRVLRGYMNDSNIKKVYACTDKDDEGVYYALYPEKEGKTLLLFNPNDKILDAVKKFNPFKIREFEIQ